MRVKRFEKRAAAIAAFPLPYELLAPELFHLLAHDAELSAASCSYVVDVTAGKPGDFRVLNGSEGTTEALRALRTAGIWPAPSNFPSIERIVQDGLKQRAFAGALYGEGCPEEGPWTPMWKERGVRFGYVLTAVARSGLAVIGLFNSREETAATSRALAMGEALSLMIAEILDRPPQAQAGPEVAIKEAQISFGPDGRTTSLGLECAEILRDAGGGGAGAVTRVRALAEAAARDLLDEMAGRMEPAVVGGPDEEKLRQGLFRLRETGPKPIIRRELARSAFGRYELTLTAAAAPGGGLQALGTVRQIAPRTVLLLRALIAADVPAREIDLVRVLDEGASLAKTAVRMEVAQSSAETLLARLCRRFDAAGRDELIDAIAEAGRRARSGETAGP